MKNFCKLVSIVVVCIAMSAGGVFATTKFDNIVIFGDSISDNGNMFALSDGAKPSSVHAYKGRWSDGPVWVEYLAKYFNAGLIDLAQGGATTGDETSVPVGLQTQVSNFLSLASSSPTLISSETLFVVWAGPNDFLTGGTDYEKAANNNGIALDMLATAGVENILICNMGDMGIIPMFNASPELSAGATMLSQAFNSVLKEVVDIFKEANPTVTVYDYDFYALGKEVIANPVSFGFTNLVTGYVNEDDTVNDDGESYFFWDDKHFTTAAHKLIARKIAKFLDGTQSAWFTSTGLLNVQQVFVDGFSASYDVVLEYVGAISDDSSDTYFKVNSITGN